MRATSDLGFFLLLDGEGRLVSTSARNEAHPIAIEPGDCLTELVTREFPRSGAESLLPALLASSQGVTVDLGPRVNTAKDHWTLILRPLDPPQDTTRWGAMLCPADRWHSESLTHQRAVALLGRLGSELPFGELLSEAASTALRVLDLDTCFVSLCSRNEAPEKIQAAWPPDPDTLGRPSSDILDGADHAVYLHEIRSGSRKLGSLLCVRSGEAYAPDDVDREFLLEVSRALTPALLAQESASRLERQELMQSKTAEAARIGTWIADLSSETAEWSPELTKILGLPEGSREGNISDLVQSVREPDRERARAFFSGSQRDFSTSEIELRVVLGRGEERTILAEGEVLLDPGHVRMIGICRDITEERRYQAERRQTQRLETMGRLAGGIAHDFNNVLMVIQGLGQMLRRSVEGEDGRKKLDELLWASERAANLSAQLLAFSRKQALEFSLLDLNSVIESMESMLRRLIGEQVHFRTALGESHGPIRGDRALLEQVLTNLVVNARDAMPHGGDLMVRTSSVFLDRSFLAPVQDTPDPPTPGHYVCLTVHDTGEGMDAATRDRIFEPFFTTKSKGTGTGLGLATVYGIIRQHGGLIFVESEAGIGTSFRVYFREQEGVAAGEAASSGLIRTGRETILLVEDDEAVRKVLCELLQSFNYQVLEADGPLAAEEWSERHPGPIDLLVTDVVLPRMKGTELAGRIRAVRPGTRVLFLSGYGAAVLDAKDLGHETRFLRKPIKASVLSKEIRTILDETSSTPLKARPRG